MLAPVKERLAKAVAAKRLTQQRADEILERLTERVEKRVARVRARTGERGRSALRSLVTPRVAAQSQLTTAERSLPRRRPRGSKRRDSCLRVRGPAASPRGRAERVGLVGALPVKSRPSRPKWPYAAVFA